MLISTPFFPDTSTPRKIIKCNHLIVKDKSARRSLAWGVRFLDAAKKRCLIITRGKGSYLRGYFKHRRAALPARLQGKKKIPPIRAGLMEAKRGFFVIN